jgi:hypothetical protein
MGSAHGRQDQGEFHGQGKIKYAPHRPSPATPPRALSPARPFRWFPRPAGDGPRLDDKHRPAPDGVPLPRPP